MTDVQIACSLQLAGFSDHLVLGVTLSETFSNPFKIVAVVAVPDEAVKDLEVLIEKDCSVTLEGIDGESKTVTGIVTEVGFKDSAGDRSLVELVIEPDLVKAAFGSNRKIFQNKNAVEICELVLRESGISLNKTSLSGQLTEREYTVQYDESDLEFVERLLASEGIGYFFKHSNTKSELVLCDSKNGYVGFGNMQGGASLNLGHFGQAGRGDETSYSVLGVTTSLTLNESRVRTYDPENASLLVDKQSKGSSGIGCSYRFDPRPLDAETAQKQSEDLLANFRAASTRVNLITDSVVLSPGVKFITQGHPRSKQIGDLVVLETRHVIENDSYKCEVLAQALDADIYVPQRVTFPKVSSLDVATVVGPEKEEVWTDKSGRILVQFKWDQYGQNDEASSCWLRVAQAWSGPGYGAQFIPRIGHEVLVDFVGGDVDKPIVVGSVYNSTNLFPFKLPGEQDVSGFKTQSFAGTEKDASWLSFCDKEKEELVNLHSNKDLLVESLDSSTHLSGASKRLAVNLGENKDKLSDLPADFYEVNVNGSKSEIISNNFELTVGGEIPWASGAQNGNFNLTVDGDYTTTVSGNMTTQVDGDATIEIGGDLSLKVKGLISITCDSDMSLESGKAYKQVSESVTINGNSGAVSVQASSGSISLEAGTAASLKAGTSLSMEGGTAASMKGAVSASVEGASATVKGSGSLALKGAAVAISQG